MSSSLLARSEEVTLRRLSAKELKARCAATGVAKGGTKEEMVSRLLNPAAHQVKARAVKKRSRRIIVCSDDDDEEQETEEDTCPSCLRPIDAEEFIHPFNGNCHACQEKEALD